LSLTYRVLCVPPLPPETSSTPQPNTGVMKVVVAALLAIASAFADHNTQHMMETRPILGQVLSSEKIVETAVLNETDEILNPTNDFKATKKVKLEDLKEVDVDKMLWKDVKKYLVDVDKMLWKDVQKYLVEFFAKYQVYEYDEYYKLVKFTAADKATAKKAKKVAKKKYAKNLKDAKNLADAKETLKLAAKLLEEEKEKAAAEKA